MIDYKVGYFAYSMAGHDKGSIYVIVDMKGEYVYLCDGKIRTTDNLKKKKIKHIQVIKKCDETISYKLEQNLEIRNEDIKLAIKKQIKNIKGGNICQRQM